MELQVIDTEFSVEIAFTRHLLKRYCEYTKEVISTGRFKKWVQKMLDRATKVVHNEEKNSYRFVSGKWVFVVVPEIVYEIKKIIARIVTCYPKKTKQSKKGFSGSRNSMLRMKTRDHRNTKRGNMWKAELDYSC